MRIAHAHVAISIGGDMAVVTGNNVFGGFTAIRIDGADAIITDNIASKNGNGILSHTANALVRGNSTSFNEYFGIRAICPSTVIENVARNNGQLDISLGPSFGDECTRANNSPTP